MTKTIATRFNPLLGSQLDYFVIDGSGSMLDKWWDLMAATDGYIAMLRDANLNSHVIATVFDHNSIGFVQRDESLCDWKSFIDAPLLLGRGYTPLYDAINAAGQHLRDLDPDRASIIFTTDGDENASSYTDVVQAASIIAWMKAKGWQVTFIGCDFNNMKQAAQLGVTEHNAIGVAKAKLLDAAQALGHKRIRHARTGEDMHFTDEEKQQFGGYLNGPNKE